jgi:acyl-CoA synthetase (NDP forming)
MDTLNEYYFIEFPVISPEGKRKLKDLLLPMATVCSPEGYADITASATVAYHVDGLDVVLKEKNVDAAIFLTVVPTFLPREELGKALKDHILSLENSKPVFICIMAGNYVMSLKTNLERANILTFDTPDRAARACAKKTY